MWKSFLIGSILWIAAACSEPIPSPVVPSAQNLARTLVPMAGVRADGELEPFPELDTVPEVSVGPLQESYAERLSDRALVEAVRRSSGRVTIGLKPLTSTHTRVSGRIPAMSREEVMDARAQIRERALRLVRTFRSLSDVVAEIDPEQAPMLRRLPFVNYLEPDESGQPGAQDTSWGLKKIGAHTVWTSYGYHGENVSITMIDTGIDSSHFNNLALDGPESLTNCLYASPPASSCYQHSDHGAAVAGVMSGRDNSAGYIGIADSPLRFSSINVCQVPPTGCSWGALTAALDWARNTGYVRHVVNISIQFCDGNSTFASALAQAVSAGILVVSIAGNDNYSCSSGSGAGTSGVTYPGKYSQVLAVSGTKEDDSFANTSVCNIGSRSGPEVDVSAPFTHSSMKAGGTWDTWCGTSFSAPTVSAAAAVLWSRNGSWTASQVRDRLIATAVELGSTGHDSQFGWGRVSLINAFSMVFAFISGPVITHEGVLETFDVSASGGTPPYTYTWRINGAVQQTGSSSSFSWTAYSNYTVSVTATDNASTTSAASSQEVTVINCPPGQETCN